MHTLNDTLATNPATKNRQARRIEKACIRKGQRVKTEKIPAGYSMDNYIVARLNLPMLGA
jgi:hypothetical protein